jgi:ATP-dependent protease Clp ATPase subunit
MLFPSQIRINKQISHLLNVFTRSEAKIRPHFHLTGPSGSGKSFLVNQIAIEMKIPFMEVNAAGLTTEGLSGNSLSKALRKLREHWNQPNIIFVDEFDKLFQRNGETTEGFRSAVQDEFLTALESKYTSVFTDYGKYEPVVINQSLFIFAGAFSNQKITTMSELKDAGLRTEFIGRVPLVFSTEEVPTEELRQFIKEISLFREYMKMYPDTKIQRAVGEITNMLVEQQKVLPIGIRLLNSCIHQYFMKGV